MLSATPRGGVECTRGGTCWDAVRVHAASAGGGWWRWRMEVALIHVPSILHPPSGSCVLVLLVHCSAEREVSSCSVLWCV